jgi:transcription initiation factor TFIID subunit 2
VTIFVWVLLPHPESVLARYYDEIKHPMDFRTLSEKLARGEYKSMEDFAEDVHLIFLNCRQFNPPTTTPVVAADMVERVFRREWGNAMRGRLTTAEKRHLVSFLDKLRNEHK